ARQIQSQSSHIPKEADHLPHFRGLTVRDAEANQKIKLAGIGVEQHPKDCHHGHKGCHLLLLIESFDGRANGLSNRERIINAAKALMSRVREISREPQRGHPLKLPPPEGDILLPYGGLETLTLPERDISVLDWRGNEWDDLSSIKSAVEGCKFVEEDDKRATISNDMAHHYYQDMPLCSKS